MSKLLRFLLCLILMLSIVMTLFAAQSVSATEQEPVTLSTGLKRDQVQARAEAMANMTWTVKSNHKVTTNVNVTVPSYVLAADVGDTLTGIPYCTGGFNGIDSCDKNNDQVIDYIKFSEIVTSSSQTAGNIKTRDSSGASIGHQSRTIGLDCSGFVCSAYGFNQHISARNLCNTDSDRPIYGNLIDFDDLKPMDFIGKAGTHVVLYLSQRIENGEVIYTIIDSSVATGKVAIREVEKSYYVNQGYQCYTPWNPQCTYQTTYTSTQHTKECSDCGYTITSAHTFRYSSNNRTTHRKYCSGCSYSINQTHTMTLNSNGQSYCSYCGYTDGTAINSIDDSEKE